MFLEKTDFTEQKPTLKKRNFLIFIIFIIFSALLLTLLLFAYIINHNEPPDNFPDNRSITIESGTDVRSITEILETNGIVQSKHLLYFMLVFFYEPTTLKASTYVFESPITTWEVAKRLAEGDFDTDLIRFTHFEGESLSKLAERAGEVLPNFDQKRFLQQATEQNLEGKLFPETYFIPPTYDNEEFIILLTDTFEKKIQEFSTEIEAYPLSLEEVLILASIIEREANSPESMKLVSSVLQNRLEIGMPLQADASIEYVLDKQLFELTPEDLKIDSPYNTYLNSGLPPTPIGNPGLDAILAVLRPTKSDYFYYLTDEEGEFHYAETYKQHLINIETYLR